MRARFASITEDMGSHYHGYSTSELVKEVEELRARLHEADETLNAIRAGEVDALVVSHADGPRIYTLESADHVYRAMVEQMQEGAITVSESGTILYCNQRFADLLQLPPNTLLASEIFDRVMPADRQKVRTWLGQARSGPVNGQVYLCDANGALVPVYLALNALLLDDLSVVCVIVTDLTREYADKRRLQQLQSLQVAISEAKGVEGALSVLLERICQFSGWTLGEAWLYDSHRQKLVFCSVWDAASPDIAPFRSAGESLRLAPGEGLPGQAFAKRRWIYIPDLEAWPGFARVDEARAIGLKAALAIPVFTADNVSAVLAFFLRDTLQPDTELIEHLSTLAMQLGGFIAHKQAEEALRESEERFRSLVQNSRDMVTILGQDGVILYESASVEHILGYHVDELLGVNAFTLVHPDDIAPAAAKLQRLLEEPSRTDSIELRFKHRDGSWRVLEVVGSNLLHVPAVGGIVVNSRDITERKLAAEEIKTLNAELEQRVAQRTQQLVAVNRELEAFSYSVSHDLRAPLRALDGFSLALLEDHAESLDPEGRFYLERIRLATQRMGQLIDDLLNLSRLTRGEIRIGPVDISALACQVITDLQAAEPLREVEVVIAPGLVASADNRLVRAALDNLLRNAWKFTGKQPAARIEVGRCFDQSQHCFFVRDNGVGFDMAYADKLFGAFQRLHSQDEFEGTGVGLATVQRVMNRHGGRVWARSEPGKGATFYFTLPSA